MDLVECQLSDVDPLDPSVSPLGLGVGNPTTTTASVLQAQLQLRNFLITEIKDKLAKSDLI